jgi:hypothetical protein
MTTARTDKCRCKTSPVQEDQDLAATIEVTPDGLDERLAEPVGSGCLHRIDQVNGRWFGATCASRQAQVFVIAVAAVVQHFQGWRRRPQDDRYVEVFSTDDSQVAG